MQITNKIVFKILLAVIFLTTAFFPQAAIADTAGSSAKLRTVQSKTEADSRVKILQAYLEKHNSPLAAHAENFVMQADKYNLDWKLVASISGVESTFGKRIPYNSYNGWGWGIYGNKVLRFNSWNEAIETISRDLRVKYMDKWGATDIFSIGRIYAADRRWPVKVNFFMKKIEDFETKSKPTQLSISL